MRRKRISRQKEMGRVQGNQKRRGGCKASLSATICPMSGRGGMIGRPCWEKRSCAKKKTIPPPTHLQKKKRGDEYHPGGIAFLHDPLAVGRGKRKSVRSGGGTRKVERRANRREEPVVLWGAGIVADRVLGNSRTGGKSAKGNWSGGMAPNFSHSFTIADGGIREEDG